MFRVSSFISFVVLFFLMTTERSTGLPRSRNGQQEGLTEKEKGHLREVIKIALEEFKDEDILKVLKESLELRLKICFSPFPFPPSSTEKTPDSNGFMEDEEFTPEQKKGLRELLLECLEYFDEQEMLDFLTHSIEFRVKYCPWPNQVLNPSSSLGPFPGPQPGPSVTPRSPTKPFMSTSEAKPKTSATIPSSQISEGNLTAEATAQSMGKEGPTENAAFEADMTDLTNDIVLEDSLSKIPPQSDEPSLDQGGIKNGATAEVAIKASKKLASSHGKSRFGIIEKDSTKEIAKRVKKLRSPQQLKLSRTDLASEKDLAKFLEGEVQRETEKPQNPIIVQSVSGAKEELGALVKRLAKKSGYPDSKLSLSNLVPDKKSVLSEPDQSEAEPKQPNDQSIVGSSEKVGKASLTANSDQGEFSSIMKIDYGEKAHEADPGVVGVNLGLIAESNDELS